jgi:ABC-type glycerol-3-phosphate transport system substrate-binding protein
MFQLRTERSRLLQMIIAILFAVAFATHSSAQSNWQQEWEKTLAEAKKEGQLNIYVYRYERLLEDFKKDYPGINVVSVTGGATP